MENSANIRQSIFLDWEKRMRDQLDFSLIEEVDSDMRWILYYWLITSGVSLGVYSLIVLAGKLEFNGFFMFILSILFIFSVSVSILAFRKKPYFLWENRDYVVGLYKLALLEKAIGEHELDPRAGELLSRLEELEEYRDTLPNKHKDTHATSTNRVVSSKLILKDKRKFDQLFKEVIESDWTSLEKTGKLFEEVRSKY